MAIARQRIHLPPSAWRKAPGAVVRGDLADGPAIREFERAFASAIGAEEAVALASGRAALWFLFDSLKLAPGSEVICSAFAYPVIPYLVRQLGFDLRFVDCEMHTLGMDPGQLRDAISERTAAIVVTHLYGVPCEVDRIAQIAREHGVLLIEDCAHCFGASVGGVKAGAIGDAAYFSFETSKVINTMGGGMVTLRDPALAERIRRAVGGEPPKGIGWLIKRLLTTSFEATVTNPLVFNLGVYQALRWAPRGSDGEDRFASGYHGDEVSLAGKLGRYTNYQAKLGLVQMEHAEERDAARTSNAERLIGTLQSRLQFQQPAGPHVKANYMLVSALVPRMLEVSHQLLRAGVDTKHHYMRECTGMFETGGAFPNAARAEREVLHLPAHPELSAAQIDEVAEKVAAVVDSLGVARTGTETG